LGLGVALALGAGCSPSVDPLPRESNLEPAGQPLGLLFPDPQPTLPPPYAGLSLGMSREAALAKMPALASEEALHTTEYPLVSFNLRFDRQRGQLTEAWFALPKLEAEQVLSRAWGAPLKATDAQQRPMRIWLNPKAGLRAVLKDGFGESLSLAFSRCLPAAVLVGPAGTKASAGPAPAAVADGGSEPGLTHNRFGFEVAPGLPDEGLLGATLPAVRQAFGGALTVDPQRSEDAPPTARIWLPPIEFDDGDGTRVRLAFDEDDRVRRVNFSLIYGHSPGAREEILSLIEARFGPAVSGERYGRAVLGFVAAPAVELRDNHGARAWEVRIEAPPAPTEGTKAP
jgi:hypothetical protein